MNILLSIILLTVSCASAQRYFISAPNVFHVGVFTNVSVTVFRITSPITVRLFLQDYPHRRKTFSPVQAVFRPDVPQFLTVRVDPKDIPDQASLDKQYVYLVAKSDDQTLRFHKETKILLSFKDGVILIQTDKPIYTPRQRVRIRIIPLGFDLMPTTKKINVAVKNPQGTRVQEWKDLDTTSGFISKVLDLGDFVLNGNWTVEAFYGHLFSYNTSIKFEVKEYVLRRFSVKIEGPPVILPTNKLIPLVITSRYTYLKAIHGTLTVRVKIVGLNQIQIPIRSLKMRIVNGLTTITIKRSTIMDLPGNIWFPEGSRLQVEADVTESSTGITEHAVENFFFFSSSKYRIKFYKTAKYFKPGLPFYINAKVTYPNNQPVSNVVVKISAKVIQPDGSEIRHDRSQPNTDVTGADGQVKFVINIPRSARTLKVKVETAERGLRPSQNAVRELVTRAYTSTNNEYLMLKQIKPGRVNKTLLCEVFLSSSRADRLSYMVVSRGQIVFHKVLVKRFGVITTIRFQVTRMMSPSARLVAYYISSNGEVIADSILLEIEDTLPNEVQIKDNDKGITSYPALEYVVNVLGSKGTRVGLLGVDQSVYLLRNDNRLTPKSVFEKLEDLDLGCGIGHGRNPERVFKNAGVTVITESFAISQRQDLKCGNSLPRQRRSAVQKRYCCKPANITDVHNKMSNRRMDDFVPGFTDSRLRVRRLEAKDMGFRARSGIDFDGLGVFGPSEDEILEMTQVRSYSPETWFFQEKVIGKEVFDSDCDKYLKRRKCGRAVLHVTLPDTITTWVVQAVAVSSTSGFGIAKPLYIKTYKDVFVRLTMPYSTQLGEQISVLATVYNYMEQELEVFFFLYGDDGFCSAAPPNERIKLNPTVLRVKAGQSVAVPIAIVPIKYGLVPIKVAVYSPKTIQADVVEKNLLVVPEGVEKRKTQLYILDPQGALKDKKQDAKRLQGLNEMNNSSFPSQRTFDKLKNTQYDNISVKFPKESIPESVGAKMYFIGYSKQTIGPNLNLQITVRSELGRVKLLKQLRINENNGSLQQSVDIFEYLGGEIFVDTVGTGVAQMQVDVRYNVPSTRKERCDFMVSATVSEDGSGRMLSRLPLNDAPVPKKRKNLKKIRKTRRKKKGKNKRINKKRNRNTKKKRILRPSHRTKKLLIRVCAQYKKPGKTGMSIMDVGIFTGYVVDENSVKEMMTKNNGKIAKYELSQTSIMFYLAEIDSATPICVAFNVSRIVDIGAAHPVPIKVYDYNEPEETCIKFYSAEKTSLIMGSCEGKSCRCTQTECMIPNPSIKNLNKLVREACGMYDYAIKVKLLLVDEEFWWITYDVVILQVIKRGRTKLRRNKVMEFRIKAICHRPNLRKGDILLVMGRYKSRKFILDNSAFVKKWGREDSRKLNAFAKRITSGACSS